MMTRAIESMFACAALCVGCGETEPPPTPPTPDLAVPLSGKRPRAMRNCPAAVAGAELHTTRTADGIILTITVDREVAADEIVARTERSLATGARTAAPPHSGRGGGPELIGFCPMMFSDAIVTYEELPAGVRIHMRARDPLEAGLVQARVESRVRALRPTSALED